MTEEGEKAHSMQCEEDGLPEMPRRCTAVDEIRSGDFANLFSERCTVECRWYHATFYLEYCLQTGTRPRRISRLLRSASPMVRLLSLRAALKYRLPVKSMMNDAFCDIRAIFIHRVGSLDDVLSHCEDTNGVVRKAILSRLLASTFYENVQPALVGPPTGPGAGPGTDPDRRELIVQQERARAGRSSRISLTRIPLLIPISSHERILLSLQNYLYDGDPIVRRRYLRLYRKFTHVSGHFISKLFSGTGRGLFRLFLHGLEDDDTRVRIETIRTIEKLATTKSIEIIMENIIDMIDEESGSVRYYVMRTLSRLTSRFKLKIDESQIEQLTVSLNRTRGNNHGIDSHVADFLMNLKYSSFHIYSSVLHELNISGPVGDDPGLEQWRRLKILRGIANNNRKLFLTNTDRIHQSISNIPSHLSMEDLWSPANLPYLSWLVVLSVTREGPASEMDETTRLNIRSVDEKLSSVHFARANKPAHFP